MSVSRHFQSAERTVAGGEAVGLDAEALEDADEEIRQRIVLILVEGEVLAVFESTACEQGREVGVRVGVRVAHAGSVENRSPVEEGAIYAFRRGETVEKVRKFLELGFFDETQLGKLVRLVAVVGQRVGACFHAGDVRFDGVLMDENGDQAGGVRVDGHAGEVIHGTAALDQCARIVFILRAFHGNRFLGFFLPLLAGKEALLEFANAFVVVVELLAVRLADTLLKLLRAVGHGIEDAAPLADFVHLCFDLGRAALDEKFPEKGGRRILAGNLDAGLGIGEAGLRADRERERRETGKVADVCGCELIHGDAVAEAATAGMRRCGEEGNFRLVAAIDFRVGNAGEYGHVLAVRLENIEVRGRFILAACGFREEILRQDSHVRLDADEAFRRGGFHLRSMRGKHGLKEGQAEGNADSTKEGAAFHEGFRCLDVHGGILI